MPNLSVSLSFSVPTGYNNSFVTIGTEESHLSFTIFDGMGTATSEMVPLGTISGFNQKRLLGQFSFAYDYKESERVLTIAGTDFQSAGTMRLATVPEGTNEFCYERASQGGFIDEERGGNLHWNYDTPLTPGLQQVLSNIVRTVSDRTIAALQDLPEIIVQIRTKPPALPLDQHSNFMMVYRAGNFQGLYDPKQTYGVDDELFTLQSVWGGEVTFKYAEAFANVIGSKTDPKVGSTWIQLWIGQFGTPTSCTSFQFNGFGCGSTLFGGHVIVGKKAASVTKGSNSVYIMPICIPHNNNNNVYMEALKYQKGVWLKNYLGS